MTLTHAARRWSAIHDSARRRVRIALARACRGPRLEPLENRVLLSAAPAASVTTTLDHSGGFADTSDLRFNGSAGLPAVTNVNDSTGTTYENVLELTDGMRG